LRITGVAAAAGISRRFEEIDLRNGVGVIGSDHIFEVLFFGYFIIIFKKNTKLCRENLRFRLWVRRRAYIL